MQPNAVSETPRLPQDVAMLARDDFAPFVGDAFEAVGAEDGTVPLILERATQAPQFTLPNAPRNAFSLLLAGPLEGPCLDNAGTYILRHATAGALPPLTITRVTPPPGSRPAAYYQVVFN